MSFVNFDPLARALSDADARLLIANEEGYAFWAKYQSYLYLEPAVQDVIAAVRRGDLESLRETLRSQPSAANPHWEPGFPTPHPIPNDSIPLFCVSEAVFRTTNQQGNEKELTQALLAAGADITIEGDIVLGAAMSFNVPGVAEALLDGGAPIDGVDGDGVPIGYAVHFGFRELTEMMARRGARLDLRFASALGRLDLVKSWFESRWLAQTGGRGAPWPTRTARKSNIAGNLPFRCGERTRQNILSQALCFASTHGRREVVEFLLSQGADAGAIVPGLDYDSPPIGWAHWRGQTEIVELLHNYLRSRGPATG